MDIGYVGYGINIMINESHWSKFTQTLKCHSSLNIFLNLNKFSMCILYFHIIFVVDFFLLIKFIKFFYRIGFSMPCYGCAKLSCLNACANAWSNCPFGVWMTSSIWDIDTLWHYFHVVEVHLHDQIQHRKHHIHMEIFVHDISCEFWS